MSRPDGKLHIAIVGLRFGGCFPPIYVEHPDVSEVTICDTDESTLKAYGDKYKISRRTMRVEDLLNESDSIRIFLKQSVQRASEEALSVLQIVEAYNKFCIARGWDPIAVSIVEERLPDLMSELFGVLKSHDIHWGYSGLSRGFHGVKFRPEYDEN